MILEFGTSPHKSCWSCGSYSPLTACALLLLSGLAVAQPMDNAGRFRKGSARYYKNGNLKQCELIGTVPVQGYPARGWIWFHDIGSVQEFNLAESTQIQGIGFPANTWVSLNEDGTLNYAFLPHPMTVQGCPCAGNGIGREGITTSFWSNGNLREFYLAFPARIRNVPLMAGSFNPVFMHETGGLKSGWLAEPYAANDTVYAPKTRLTFSEEGEITDAYRRTRLSQFWTDFLDLIF